MPWLFVLIWSTGFIVARLAMPHAPPLTFLVWRYGLSLLALAAWALWARAAWPKDRRTLMALVLVGILLQAGYLGGVWAAVRGGLSAGTTALIVALQPVLTAVYLEWQGGEGRVRPLQWLGLALGLAGVAVVVSKTVGQGSVTLFTIGLAVVALFSITAGTLVQKFQVGAVDARTAAVVQLAAAFSVTLPWTTLETAPMVWHSDVVIALAWSVLALTMGANLLLYLLVQRGAAMRVASLFYLVPPCTAVLAWLLFDDPWTWRLALGLLLTALGVALVQRPAR